MSCVNTSTGLKAAIEALRAGKLDEVRAAIKADPKAARGARVVGAAAGRALQPALVLLKKAGADLNAVWRNYRPLHNLLQTEPHAAGGKPDPARLACLEWLLDNGADPELLGAWPSARAIIVAAFVGSPEYVKVLRPAARKSMASPEPRWLIASWWRRRCAGGRISRATAIMAA